MLASEIVAGSFVFDLAGSFPENKWSQKKEKAKNHKVDDDDVHLRHQRSREIGNEEKEISHSSTDNNDNSSSCITSSGFCRSCCST